MYRNIDERYYYLHRTRETVLLRGADKWNNRSG